MVQTPQERYHATLRHALQCQSVSPAALDAAIEVSKPRREIAIASSAPTKASASASRTERTLRNPANRLWTKTSQRETFMHHLRIWASHHDSSAYFHGTISLQEQATMPEAIVELGRSVKCLLFDSTSGGPPTQIVIRLYQSNCSRHDDQRTPRNVSAGSSDGTSRSMPSRRYKERHQTGLMGQPHQSVPLYHMVVRSGSGWMAARQYLDKHHFNNRARTAMEAHSRSLARTRRFGVLQQRPTALISDLVSNGSGPAASHITTQQTTTIGHSIAAASTNITNVQGRNYQLHTTQAAGVISMRRSESSLRLSLSGRDNFKISPLFRPFSRLPPELQDEILYHAIGYTGRINIHRVAHAKTASPPSSPPITISRLFRISKMINEHMVAHLFRSTNFQFGITGFTKFLWQIGPINRSYLQNLTFRFGKASLLHSIRWLAPDPLWELFEPPVATNPPSLTYFWRCQLQDLMKELRLLTLTVDIRDVPLADVCMLVKIIRSAIGSTQHVYIIDNLGTERKPRICKQALYRRFSGFQEPTWRELGFQYHADYKHQRWHMRHKLTHLGVDVRPVLREWMDQNRAFFDA